MKPLKLNRRTAAAILAGSLAASAALFPGCSRMASLYGPPPTEEFDPGENENEDLYGPPPTEEFDPGFNENEDLYGPPPTEDFETEAAEDAPPADAE